MSRLFLALLASFGLGLLYLFVEQVQRPLARLARAAMVGMAWMLGVAGLAIAAAGLADEAWWAAILGGGVLVMAVRLAWGLRRPRRPSTFDEPQHVPLTRAAPDSGWHRFEGGLDWIGRKQARRSRASIDAFLAERGSASLTPDHQSLLLSCEKRVPELIETCLERCRNASREERDRYIDETLDRLNRIGAEAEQARREVRQADDRRLQTLHRYFDARTDDGQRGPR